MEISEIGSALSNPTRVRLLKLLSSRDYSASGAHKEYNAEFDEKKHRESIYRELENLVECGVLEKKYETSEKELRYSINYRYIKIDLETSTAEMTNSSG